jgi:hypothetical protein
MFRLITAALACMTLASTAPASAEIITPEFNPEEFSSHPEVTNPYFPLTPGTIFFYKGRREGKASADRSEVTHERQTILGVEATVVHDRGFINGKLHEDTIDWYAQDKSGNVWYFGEATEELNAKGERENTEGSWKAGEPTEGGGPIAKPGIFMPGKPTVHVGYKQEVAPPAGEDQFEVLSLKASVTTPYISTNHVMRTKETSPLEPGVVDNKYFALGIGTVIETTVKGPEDRLELVKVTRP